MNILCFCCLLGRKIGSLVTQPQPTIDWHHFLQNYHVLVFVVISFDDSENPHNQLANSFDFTGFSQEMSNIPGGSGSPDLFQQKWCMFLAPPRKLRRSDQRLCSERPFWNHRALEKKKSTTELPTDLGGDSVDSVWSFFLTWPYYPCVVSVAKTTKLSVWPLDLFAKLLCRYMWKPVAQQTQKIRNVFICCFHVCCSSCWWKKLCNGWSLKNTVNWLN